MLNKSVLWLLPALLVVLPGLYTLTFDFAYDDSWAVMGEGRILQLQDYESSLFSGRVLKNITFDFDRWVSGGAPWFFHLHSVLWGSLNAVLVVFLALTVTSRPGLALAAGVLFAVHPVHVETVANIANRKDLMAFAFGVGAVIVICRDLRRRDLPRPGWLALAGSMLLLSALSKEVVTAGVLGFLGLLVPMSSRFFPDRKGGGRFSPRLALLAALAILVGVTLALSYLPPPSELYSPGRIAQMSEGRLQTGGDWIVRSLSGASRSLALLVFPWGLSADHPLPLGGIPGLILGLTGVSLLIGALIAAYRIAPRAPGLAFGLLWLAPSLLPVMNILPISLFFVAERYLYLPSLGIAIAGAALLEFLLEARLAGRKALWATALTSITVAGLVVSLSRFPIWTDDRHLWAATVIENTESFRAHNNLAGLLNDEGRYEEAEHHYREALRFASNHAHLTILCDLGIPLLNQRKFEAAEEVLREALAQGSQDAACRFNLGVSLLRQERREEAIAEMERAVQADPGMLSMRINLIKAYMKKPTCKARAVCAGLTEPAAVPENVSGFCDQIEAACP